MHTLQRVRPQMCPGVSVETCVLILFGLLCLFYSYFNDGETDGRCYIYCLVTALSGARCILSSTVSTRPSHLPLLLTPSPSFRSFALSFSLLSSTLTPRLAAGDDHRCDLD